MTTDLLKTSGYLNDESIVKPREASDEEILLVHKSDYVNAVKHAGKNNLMKDKLESFGLDTEDTPAFPDMHEKSKRIVGATLTAVDLVMSGKTKKAVNLSGGLHHGFSGRANGFCIYNDPAIAIEYMRKYYNQRVLYVDTDAHHGDGVQWMFYDSNEVMTYSIHETGRYLFPGTGSLTERGGDQGFGFSVNLPIDAFTEDESFLEVFKESLTKAIKHFKPDVIISQNGVDSHFRDPITHLSLTSKSYEEIPRIVNQLSEEYTNGKWIAVGGGGYNIWQVVPRMWSHIWMAMCDIPKPEGRLPQKFLEQYQPKSKVDFPTHWEDHLSDKMDIPRKSEIAEKNRHMLSRALMYLDNI